MSPFGWCILENIATLAAMAAIISVGFYFGLGGHAFWGFVLLLNLGSPTSSTK